MKQSMSSFIASENIELVAKRGGKNIHSKEISKSNYKEINR